MGADQALQWIPWEQLTNRAAETTHSEKEWKISFDSRVPEGTSETSNSGGLHVRRIEA